MIQKKKRKIPPQKAAARKKKKNSRAGYFSQEMESGNFGVLSQPSEMGDKMEN